MLTDDVLDYLNRSVLCWLATADADGTPNVSPKEVFCAFGRDSILIANIASPGSVRNILINPRVCLSFVDVFVQKGYKLRGHAAVVTSKATRYHELLPTLTDITKGAFSIPSIVAMQVTAVEPIVAPGYRLISGTTEASQIASAMKTYGVIAKPFDA
jgi:predicted pyridoxine 5'-phosphate oxidase superfamily flavin-nucleotide-binding protein